MKKTKAYVNKIINKHCDGSTWLFNVFGIGLVSLAFVYIVGAITTGSFTGFNLDPDEFRWTSFIILPLFFINDLRRANSILNNNTKGFIVVIIMTSLGIISEYNELAFFKIMSLLFGIWMLFANSKRKKNEKSK